MIRTTALTLLIAAAGCMHAPAPVTVAAPRAVDTPQLVVNPPPRSLYRYVGRVEGVARSCDLVRAAREANDELRWKAHSIGADVVRIDYVAEPADRGRASCRVLLAGRAYKAIAHP